MLIGYFRLVVVAIFSDNGFGVVALVWLYGIYDAGGSDVLLQAFITNFRGIRECTGFGGSTIDHIGDLVIATTLDLRVAFL